ncbi:GNAT family N-acetyltransferase [Lentibacillus cibarius]|uniref:GNAT family N-acetyltransferase n=1 Tax=Lentibacillus cibarius TaxID=2583219 RepID=A0A549YFY4_9BACI|nr:GNAT family N-acetyltransferase [Lentibacillus cibarius]TRM10785.1 GNAT family N-acetyltransferase [Lentibacillus cibarius]
MEIIAANHASEEKLQRFLKDNKDVEKNLLLEKGYVVEIDDTIEGCFVLDTVEDDIYWLKQLYVTKNKAGSLPVLLETILALAKEKQAKQVYVHSHQPMVDVLLEALQFYPQKENEITDKLPKNNGNWWTYNVS